MKNIVSKLTALAFGATLFAGAAAAPIATPIAKTIDVTSITTHGSALGLVPTTNFGKPTLSLQTWDVHTADGSVFLALCIEPKTQMEKAFGDSYVGTDFTGFANDTQIQRLYSGYYTKALASVEDSRSFQLALWELYSDKGDVLLNGTTDNRGDLSFTYADTATSAGAITVRKANEMLQFALGDTDIVNKYSFTQYTLTGYQTVVSAAPLAAVPEPSTYAMMGLGLALIGLTSRRRSKR